MATLAPSSLFSQCLPASRWRQPVFTAPARPYDWLDVFLAAMLRGDWITYERPLLTGLACAAEASAAPSQWPDDDRIDARATAFRYEHNLITADETLAWLGAAGLELADWTEFLAREILRDDWATRLDSLMNVHAASLDVTLTAFAADGICSGRFRDFATALAGRVAVAGASAPAPDSPTDGHAFDLDSVASHYERWLAGLDPGDLRARLEHLAGLEAAFAQATAAAVTPDAIAAQVARARLEWTRVDLERLSLPSRDAAQEAVLCVREDGLSLSDVAYDARVPLRDSADVLGDLEPELRDAVLSASVDTLIGPVAVNGRFEVVQLVGKRPPDPDDPLVRRLAWDAIVDDVVSRAVLTRIRWVDPLFTRSL